MWKIFYGISIEFLKEEIYEKNNIAHMHFGDNIIFHRL